MTDLISRSAAIEALNQHSYETISDYDKTVELLNELPAIDAVPVVHARWISEVVTKCDWKGRLKQYYQPCSCSACHEPAIREHKYCPNCGARMDAKEDTDGSQDD